MLEEGKGLQKGAQNILLSLESIRTLRVFWAENSVGNMM